MQKEIVEKQKIIHTLEKEIFEYECKLQIIFLFHLFLQLQLTEYAHSVFFWCNQIYIKII